MLKLGTSSAPGVREELVEKAFGRRDNVQFSAKMTRAFINNHDEFVYVVQITKTTIKHAVTSLVALSHIALISSEDRRRELFTQVVTSEVVAAYQVVLPLVDRFDADPLPFDVAIDSITQIAFDAQRSVSNEFNQQAYENSNEYRTRVRRSKARDNTVNRNDLVVVLRDDFQTVDRELPVF